MHASRLLAAHRLGRGEGLGDEGGEDEEVEAVDPDQVALVVHLHHLNFFIWDHVTSCQGVEGRAGRLLGIGRRVCVPSIHTPHTHKASKKSKKGGGGLIYIHTQTHIEMEKKGPDLVAEAHVDVGVGVPHAVLRLLVPEPVYLVCWVER